MPTDPVHQLTALAGHPPRRAVAIAWPAVEASISSRLPADYRSLLETLPDGAFRDALRINRPGDQERDGTEFLGYYATWLDTWRSWRSAGRGSCPYPIFPEPGGLLPWATGPRMAPVFWLTDGDDPDRWPVVLADGALRQWARHPGPAAAFLLDALTGRFDTRPFGFDLASDELPPFVPAVSRPAATPVAPAGPRPAGSPAVPAAPGPFASPVVPPVPGPFASPVVPPVPGPFASPVVPPVPGPFPSPAVPVMPRSAASPVVPAEPRSTAPPVVPAGRRPFGAPEPRAAPTVNPEPPASLEPRPARDFFAARGRAADEFHELATLLGAPPAPHGEPLSDDLPADYRRFLATYGPGRLGDIVVPAPGVLLPDVHLRLRLAHFPCAVHPEPGGVIAWGRTDDGGILAWAPTVPDPQSWGTVAIAGDLSEVRHGAEFSFTGLLRRYADLAADPPSILAGRARPPSPVHFLPAR